MHRIPQEIIQRLNEYWASLCHIKKVLEKDAAYNKLEKKTLKKAKGNAVFADHTVEGQSWWFCVTSIRSELNTVLVAT